MKMECIAWSDRIHGRLARRERSLAVLGLGYAGLPLALRFARGYRVTGYDIDARRIAKLRSAIDPAGLLPREAFEGCDILFTDDESRLSEASFYIVTVPTPVDEAHRPDIGALLAATRSIARHLSPGDCVVYESTVWPGCTEERCIPLLEAVSGLRAGRDFKVGYSPERINPGDEEHTLAGTVKVVSGCDAEALDAIARVYAAAVEAGIFRASAIRVAEAAKILENIQRDVNIALMNECSELFARLGIDTTEVLRTAATKWNFGHYRPGLVGGHCIGVDPYYLLARAEEAGVELPVMRASRTINERTSGRIARELTQALTAQGKHPSGSRVLLLGMTYKADVADCRNTKSADLFRAFERAGFRIQAADPYADAQEVCDTYGIELTEELQPPYDLVVVAVGHTPYRAFDEAWFRTLLTPDGIVADLGAIYHGKFRSLRYWSL
ncbi:nucleotide sugar dehydrogenase [uncultured Alistipes sp.]|uniref:nucleotide sugar dehydrogenase n=1 Tax=uncultured Alistipes sp. TaxID=538949 RepID=UPI002616AEF9|nr:nucleotide sugar dehydrogenase [uncultured Alistipes sp.]